MARPIWPARSRTVRTLSTDVRRFHQLINVDKVFGTHTGPSWEWIIAANSLLGINQGLAWSMTVIMEIDLVGPKSRGLAVGLNEFAGYLTVGLTAFATGYLAAQYGLRPVPIYLGVAKPPIVRAR